MVTLNNSSTSVETDLALSSNIPELLITETDFHDDAEECRHKELDDHSRSKLRETHDISIPLIEQLVETSKIVEILQLTEDLQISEKEESTRKVFEYDEVKDLKEQETYDYVPSEMPPAEAVEQLPPAKPPRQITVEPDIVASTKKPGPSRPPPPLNAPPPRPPPPVRPPRKKKYDSDYESPRSSGLECKYAPVCNKQGLW